MRRRVFQEELAAALKEADQVVIGKVFSPPAQDAALDPNRVAQEIREAKGKPQPPI